MRSKIFDRKKKKSWSEIHYYLIILILTSFIVIWTAFSGFSGVMAYFHSINSGPTIIYPPTGYGIIRGMGSFPSDHLFIPMEWTNSGGKSLFVRQPYLILYESNNNGSESKKRIFTLAGQSEKIFGESFKIENFDYSNSFLLNSNGATYKILIFHTQNYWDKNISGDYNFMFSPGQEYNVYINYQENDKERVEKPLMKLTVYSAVDKLKSGSDKWWDYFPLDYDDVKLP